MNDPQDPIVALAEHALQSSSAAFSADEVTAATMILLDTVAVGIAGCNATYADAVHGLAPRWGGNGPCRALGRGSGLPAASAAFLNAYQIHGQEYDCVHEPAVVHPMAAIMATALAELEQLSQGGDETGVSGRQWLDALSAAVDVAITVGLSAQTGLRFFRPATAGAFGAAAVAARLRGFNHEQTVLTFGHLYSQLCGTMQAHTEGSAVLPMQIGFNARNAVIAADLASAGISAPAQVISGPYGYHELFEPGGKIADLLPQLGQRHRITELSYKPFPTGRATHGGLDGILTLLREHEFDSADVTSVKLWGPPLIPRLVARPVSLGMPANYARLCMQYVGAIALAHGTVGLFDFDEKTLKSERINALANRIEIIDDGSPDPNALVPQRVEITLGSGEVLTADLPEVIGSPAKPLSHDGNLGKIRHCLQFAEFSDTQANALIDTGLRVTELADVGECLQHAWRADHS
jgi:2-methylcitrate dehydratase PrpD